MIRVAVIDDHVVVRTGLKYIIEADPELEFAGDFGGGLGAADFVGYVNPDVVLLDVRMPDRNGIDTLKDLLAANASARIVMLTTSDAEEDVFRAIENGALGYVMKESSIETITAAVHSAMRGDVYMSDEVRQIYETRKGAKGLSPRETEVLRTAAQGMSNREIGAQMGISENSVKMHLKRIFFKLGASDRAGAVTTAIQRGLISVTCLAVCALLSWGAEAGVHNVTLDASPDRVETPLRPALPRIGTIRPRAVGEIGDQNWRLGCEVLDRDFMNFDEYAPFVAPLGIRTVRLQGGWAKCEQKKGVYDFAWLDHIVDTLRAAGVSAALETSYGNPIYAGGGTRDLAAGFPTSETALAAWDAWVEALARHFKGRVNTFLAWNEPDIKPLDGSPAKTPEQIAAFDVRTARVIRKVIPEAHLAGLSLAHCKAELFEKCLVAMGDDARLFDSFIYHGYAPAPESSYAEVERIKAVLAKHCPKAVLWQGENGCPSEMAHRFALSRIPWSEYSQAKWNMRRMLGDLGHDVLSSVYTISDFPHAGREINLKGLLRANEDKEVIGVKRAYYAVQNVVSVFDATWHRVKDSSCEKGFGTTDRTISTYHYVKETGEPLFVFWTHGSVLARGSGPVYERPGDSFETRPAAFRYTGGKPLVDPVWVDLLTGRIYAFPKNRQVASRSSIRFFDVPVYDSPCLLTERRAVLR